MSDPYIGEIRLFSYAAGFTVEGYLPCTGGLYSIGQYPALYAIIGTRFGGDGKTTFKVPNLASHIVIGSGTGPGLTPRALGQTLGTETVTLTQATMPNHTHDFAVAFAGPTKRKATPNNTTFLSNFLNGTTNQKVWTETTPNTAQSVSAISNTGTSSPIHSNIQPILTACYYQIAYTGEFPVNPN